MEEFLGTPPNAHFSTGTPDPVGKICRTRLSRNSKRYSSFPCVGTTSWPQAIFSPQYWFWGASYSQMSTGLAVPGDAEPRRAYFSTAALGGLNFTARAHDCIAGLAEDGCHFAHGDKAFIYLSRVRKARRGREIRRILHRKPSPPCARAAGTCSPYGVC